MKLTIAVFCAIYLSVIAAQAHSFTVTMVLPTGESATAMQAFLIASAERDSHPDETSDGHLGGVDAHVQFVETSAAAEVIVSAPDIIVVLAPGEIAQHFDTEAWVFTLSAVSTNAAQDFLGGDAPFAARFEDQTGAMPSDVATRVYVAARLIDIAVRTQDGADDVAALTAAIARY